MKLLDKGAIQAPPVMPGVLGLVATEIQSWPGVIAVTHWDLYRRDVPDGADYYLGETEIGHLHFSGEAHVASDKAIRDRFIQQGNAQAFRFSNTPNYQHWTQVMVTTPEQVRYALDLFRANYERLLRLK